MSLCKICFENAVEPGSIFCNRCFALKNQVKGQLYRKISPQLCVTCEWFNITCANHASWSGTYKGQKNMCGFYVPAVVVDNRFVDRANQLDFDGNEVK